MLDSQVAEGVRDILTLGCRVQYQESSATTPAGIPEVVLSIYGPPALVSSKRFQAALNEGKLYLQTPVRHDVEIPYHNPQYLRSDKSEGCPFVSQGQWYTRKVLNVPAGDA